MVNIKSKREIDLMKKAGKIVALAHKRVSEEIKPGVSTKYLDKIVEETILENGALPSFKGYSGFPASACISINDEIIHGIPNENRYLKNGDIVSIDIGANFKGYHGDSAWTYPCGDISNEAKELLDITKQCLFDGLNEIKNSKHLSDISNRIQKTAEDNGYSVVQEYGGHGVGKLLHEDPVIPNYGEAGMGLVIKEGMTLAIEPMINIGNRYILLESDGWTVKTVDSKLSAHFEHTIVVTDNGYEILTKL